MVRSRASSAARARSLPAKAAMASPSRAATQATERRRQRVRPRGPSLAARRRSRTAPHRRWRGAGLNSGTAAHVAVEPLPLARSSIVTVARQRSLVRVTSTRKAPSGGHVVERRRAGRRRAPCCRLGRRDLAHEGDDLRAGERGLRHRARRAGDLELGQLVLVEPQRGGALARHDGQQSIDLGHAAQATGRT